MEIIPTSGLKHRDDRVVYHQRQTGDGYPVVFYGHGVGNSKEQGFPVALTCGQGHRDSLNRLGRSGCSCCACRSLQTVALIRQRETVGFQPRGCYYPLLAITRWLP